jgi:hypothetical protein
MRRLLILIAGAVVLAAAPSWAKNVDLVTLPARDTVQLTIYNSEDITLVKETRSVTLKKGLNKLQFSWANTLIDPTSVTFRPLEHKDDVELLDTVFPGQKPQHLIWNVESRFEGQVRVEVTYFTSGLTWSMDYVAITDPDETKMHFRGYVRVFNNSGEEYENANVRLIVGTINLVEKIAELAKRRGIPVPQPTETLMDFAIRRDAIHGAMDEADHKEDGAEKKPKEIVKEGLSEYFLFSVSGEETIPNGWSKRMQAVEARDVPFDIVYRMRGFQYGPRPVRFFIWRNDDEHKLGESPLPDGQVNLFRQERRNGADGLAFLARQKIRYVPIKAEIEINLGPDDLVVYETARMGTERLNFHFHRIPDPPHEVVDGWDERTNWVDTIRNYRTKSIKFELRRQWGGDVDYDSEVATTLFDYRTTETTFDIDARSKRQYPATVTAHFGANASQQRVKLKETAR